METIKVNLCGVEYKIEFIKNYGFDECIFVKKTKFGYKVRHEIKNISSDTMLLGELIAEIKKFLSVARQRMIIFMPMKTLVFSAILLFLWIITD